MKARKIINNKKVVKTESPLISVLMPVHNAGEFLSEAIESILGQTYKNFEFIIVDDGSTDNSLGIIKNYQKQNKRIKVLRNKTKKGIGYSLNQALKIAKGEFIARMDADDISLPNRFAVQINLLQKNPSVVACGGQAAMINHQGETFAYKNFPTDSDKLYKMIMMMIPLQHPILMARAKILKPYRYNEKIKTAEDVDMLFYLLSKGKLTNIDRVIYQYRKSSASNGYHSIKKTFSITFKSRFGAIQKYGYRPTISGLIATLSQYFLVNLLPSKFTMVLFEAFRFEKPLWQRVLPKLLQPAIR